MASRNITPFTREKSYLVSSSVKLNANAVNQGSIEIQYLPKFLHVADNNDSENITINDKYKVDPYFSHIYYCELQSLMKLTKSDDTRDWWLADLRSDYDELISHSHSTKESSNDIFYPILPLNSSGVISLYQSDNNALLNTLKSAYKGQRGSATSISNQIKKKITFLSTEGVALKSIEFTTEKDYWGVIYAVKRYTSGQDVSFSGRCSLSISNQTQSDSTFTATPVKTEPKSSIFSILSSSNAHTETPKDDSSYTLELKNGVINILDRSNSILTFKIDDIQAIAITVDSPKTSPYLLKASILNSQGLSLQFNKSSTEVAQIQKPVIASSLVLPLPIDQLNFVAHGDSKPGLISDLDTNYLPSSVTILSNLAIQSGNTEQSIMGTNEIPYQSLISYDSNNNPIVRLNDPIFTTTKLKEVEVRRGVRIYIQHAMGLPSSSSRNTPPSAYCTVYLVGQNNDKLSLNTIESRTEVIEKTFDPEWDKDIILEGGEHVQGIDTSGLDGVEGVMIKVRDASSGFLKHHHIGQVVIPINCFIYQTEAKFTLPLEPTYRMNQNDNKYLGEISLITELVTLESTLKVGGQELVNGLQVGQTRARRLSIVSPREHSHYLTVRNPESDGVKTTTISYCAFDTTLVSSMYWPFHTLFGGDASGHIKVAHHSLLIKLQPGAGGLLTNCQELDTEENTFVTIPWRQVSALSAVSEGVLIISLTVNSITSVPYQKPKGDVTYTTANIDILVAPCPSQRLERIIVDRLELNQIRSRLRSYIHTVRSSEYGNTSGMNDDHSNSPMLTRGNTPTGSPPISPVTQSTRARSSVLWSSNTSTQPYHEHRGSCKQYISEASNIFHLIEQSMKTINNNKESVMKTSDMSQEVVIELQNYQRHILHLIIYTSQLVDISKSFSVNEGVDAPIFRLDYVHKIVDEDCSDAQILTPLRAEANPSSLSDRHDYICDIAIQRLTQFLVCSGDTWGTFVEKDNKYLHTEATVPSSNKNQSFMSPPLPKPSSHPIKPIHHDGIASATPESNGFKTSLRQPLTTPIKPPLSTPIAKQCIEELLSGYANALRLSLFPYINNKASFERVEGQDLKHVVLRLIIDTNVRLHNLANRTLCTFGLTIPTTSLFLVDTQVVSEVIEWYSQTLVKETKTWLTRTLQHATTNKVNTCDVPWDFELFGATLISHLPETLQTQLNVYLEKCTDVYQEKEKSKEEGVIASTLSLGQAEKYRALRRNSQAAFLTIGQSPTDGNESKATIEKIDVNKEDATVIALHCKLNEKIFLAVTACMALLSEEYSRALQMKHWDQIPLSNQPASDDKQLSLIMCHKQFLCSIINDCSRMLTTYIPSFDSIANLSTTNIKADVLTRVAISYLHAIEKSIKYIVRIIFADVSNLLLDWDIHCVSDNTIIRTLTAALTYHFKDLLKILTFPSYLRIVQSCMGVISKRYFVTFKDRVGKGKQFTPQEAMKIYNDINQLGKYFQSEVIPSSHMFDSASSLILSKQFGYLSDVMELQKLDPESSGFTSLIRSLLYRYHSASAPIYPPTVLTPYQPINQPAYLPTYAPDYYPNIPIALCLIFLRLRSDFNSDVESLVTNLHNESYLTHNASQQKSYITPYLTIDVSSSASPVRYANELCLEDYYLAVLSNEEVSAFAPAQSKDTSYSISTNLPSNLLGGFAALTSPTASKNKPPSSAIKVLRDKTTDLSVLNTIGVGIKRKNEEYALQLYRNIGLEDVVEESPIPFTPARLETKFSMNDINDDHVSVTRGNTDKSISVGGLDEVYGDSSETYAAGLVDCSIVVSCLKVKGLRSASYFSSANPYIAVSLGPQRLKTSVKSNSSDADWGSTVLRFKAIRNLLGSVTMYLRVYDKEVIRRKRLLGSVSVSLAGIDVRPIASWFALEGGESGSTGDVYVKIEFDNKV